MKSQIQNIKLIPFIILSSLLALAACNVQPSSSTLESTPLEQSPTIQVDTATATLEPGPTSGPGESLTEAPAATPMILIPSGAFEMGNGASNNGPVHTVILSDYLIDQFEVSNTLYAEFLNDLGNQEEEGEPWLDLTSIEAEGHLHEVNSVWIPDEGYADHPIVEVTWYGSRAFCEWRGARLPTEAEWEKAARGDDERRFPWGEDIDCDFANYRACQFDETRPIDSYPQGVSPYGVYNLAGNASEWTADWYAKYPDEQIIDPKVTEPTSYGVRVVRGGSWYSSQQYLAVYHRNLEFGPLSSFSNLGFRCAADPLSQEGQAGDMNLDKISVPLGNPPIIDGEMSPGEWDDAIVEAFADGSELHIKRANGYLYMGIRANTPGMIAGNVYVERAGEIVILHISAALGTAVYQQGEQAWQQTQDFNWQGRSTSLSEAALAEREAFLQHEGWVSVNSRVGTPNELEYQIAITDETLRLAVNFIRTSNTKVKVPWPADLDDDSITPTPGGLPEALYFSPEQWGTLVGLK